jgi:bifunctional non-homologous end joining protein LigD
MNRIPPGEPLPLEFAPAASRLPERITPMRPTDGAAPFDDPRYFFEPWWPGIRAFVLVEGGAVRLRAEALTDPTAVFPELAGVAGLVRGDAVVLDTTLMVLDARGRPSRTLLERRLAGSGGGGGGGGSSGVGGAGSGGGARAAGTTGLVGTAALVAADLLYLDGASLAGRPFGERRGELAALMAPSPWCLAGRGFVGDGTTVAEALGAMGFRALSARRLDAPLRTGAAGDAWYRVPVVAAPRELPPLLAVFRRLPL